MLEKTMKLPASGHLYSKFSSCELPQFLLWVMDFPHLKLFPGISSLPLSRQSLQQINSSLKEILEASDQQKMRC